MKNHVAGRIGFFLLIAAALVGLGDCTLSPVAIQGGMGKRIASQPPASMADFEHFIGRWQGTYTSLDGFSFSDNFVFRRDGTYTEMANFPPVVMDSGEITVDPVAQTITVVVTYSSDESTIPMGYTSTSAYSFSEDHQTLTVVSLGEGMGAGTGVYIKQTSKDDFEHFVGEWQGTYTGSDGFSFIDNFTFRRDGTYTETADLQPPLPLVTDSGIMVVDPTAGTVSVVITSSDSDIIPPGYTTTYSYSFSNNYKTLTCVIADGAGTGVYNKQ